MPERRATTKSNDLQSHARSCWNDIWSVHVVHTQAARVGAHRYRDGM